MRKFLILLACGAVFSLLAAFLSTADARRGGGGVHMGGHSFGHVRAGGTYGGHVNRNVAANRNMNVNRNFNRNVDRNVNRNVNVNRDVNVNRNVNVNRDVNRRYVYRDGRRGYWRNGVWIAAPLAAGAVGYVASCA